MERGSGSGGARLRRNGALEIVNVANRLEYAERVREIVLFYQVDYEYTDYPPGYRRSTSAIGTGADFLARLHQLIGEGYISITTRHMKAEDTRALLGFEPRDFDFNLANGSLYIES